MQSMCPTTAEITSSMGKHISVHAPYDTENNQNRNIPLTLVNNCNKQAAVLYSNLFCSGAGLLPSPRLCLSLSNYDTLSFASFTPLVRRRGSMSEVERHIAQGRSREARHQTESRSICLDAEGSVTMDLRHGTVLPLLSPMETAAWQSTVVGGPGSAEKRWAKN